MEELSAKMQQITDGYQKEAEEFDADLISDSDGNHFNMTKIVI